MSLRNIAIAGTAGLAVVSLSVAGAGLHELNRLSSENQRAFENAGGVRHEQGEIVETYRVGNYDVHYYENDVARYCGPYGLSGRVDLQNRTYESLSGIQSSNTVVRGVVDENTAGVIPHIADKDTNLVPVEGNTSSCPVVCDKLDECVPGTNVPKMG